jgi:bifunctional non-homologous end joining protein LigD
MARRAKSRGSPAEGAKLAEMPGFIKPQLATLKSKPSGRLNEIKYDGYRRSCKRAMAARRPIRATDLIGPSGSLRSRAFDIPGQAIVDGEAVVIKDGRTNFSEPQAALAYYAFHLLYLDGYDLRAVPQIECKRLLKELFDKYGLSAPRCDEQSVSVERRKAASTAGH